jgi:hypothetical protein
MPVADEKIPRRDAINYLLGAGIGAELSERLRFFP